MYRRTALKASLLAFCKNDESLAAVRSYRWSSSFDPLAVGRGRVPLLYNKCLALSGIYLIELEFTNGTLQLCKETLHFDFRGGVN